MCSIKIALLSILLSFFTLINCDNKIWNGEPVTDEKKYPYVGRVSLFRTQQFECTIAHTCTAIYVKESWFLSTRHCFENKMPHNKICMGINVTDLSSLQCPKCQVERNIIRVISIPSKYIDLAMVQVSQPFPIRHNLTYAPLTKESNVNYIGRICKTAGWGSIREPYTLPEKLMEATLKVINFNKIGRMIIGYSEVSGACDADSGAPLVCDGFVVGILTESGPELCKYYESGYYVIFTVIEYFMDFINDPQTYVKKYHTKGDFIKINFNGCRLSANITLLLILLFVLM